MTPQTVIEIGREALMVTLLVSSPLLFCALLIGLSVSIFQAITQINEMTLTYVPKILAVSAALLLFLPWIITKLTDFTRHMFEMIPTLVG